MFVLLATSVYVSEFLQTFRDSTPLEAGLALLPLGAATAILAARLGPPHRTRSRPHADRGWACCAPRPERSCSAASAPMARRACGPALFALGAGAGIALPATTATAVAAVAATRTGMASAIHNAGRQVGATLGVAVLGSIVTAHAAAGTAGGYADGLSIALLVATTALVVTAAIASRLVPA